MKRSAQFWLKVMFISFFSIPVIAQEENENAGMPVRDVDGNVYRVIMTESGVWMEQLTGKPLTQVRQMKYFLTHCLLAKFLISIPMQNREH